MDAENENGVAAGLSNEREEEFGGGDDGVEFAGAVCMVGALLTEGADGKLGKQGRAAASELTDSVMPS